MMSRRFAVVFVCTVVLFQSVARVSAINAEHARGQRHLGPLKPNKPNKPAGKPVDKPIKPNKPVKPDKPGTPDKPQQPATNKPGQICPAAGMPCKETYPCKQDCNGRQVDTTCHKVGVCSGPGGGAQCSWGPQSRHSPSCSEDTNANNAPAGGAPTAGAGPTTGGGGGGGGGGDGGATGGGPQGNSGAAPAAITGEEVFTHLPVAQGSRVWQFYGDTNFARQHRAQWYSAAQGMHNGIDYGIPYGSPLYAACNGKVVSAGNAPFRAGPRTIIIKCGNWYVLYGHIDQHSKNVGDDVVGGDQIATSGNPSGSNGAGNDHLHFEVRPANGQGDGPPVNPGTCTNPLRLFSSALRDAHSSMGNVNNFCTGDLLNQPDIRFGGAMKEGACG